MHRALLSRPQSGQCVDNTCGTTSVDDEVKVSRTGKERGIHTGSWRLNRNLIVVSTKIIILIIMSGHVVSEAPIFIVHFETVWDDCPSPATSFEKASFSLVLQFWQLFLYLQVANWQLYSWKLQVARRKGSQPTKCKCGWNRREKEPKEERGEKVKVWKWRTRKLRQFRPFSLPLSLPLPLSGRRCKVCNADNGLRICARIYSQGIL